MVISLSVLGKLSIYICYTYEEYMYQNNFIEINLILAAENNLKLCADKFIVVSLNLDFLSEIIWWDKGTVTIRKIEL